MKVKFYTLGCKVNQYETEAISEELLKNGFEITKDNDADIFIVNSCTVTSFADKKTCQAVRRFKRLGKEKTVILTGCMPEAYPQKAKELFEADVVLGNKNNNELLKLLLEFKEKKERIFKVEPHEKNDKFVPCSINRFEERTRAYVKIEDGCDRFCSYCVIPYSRGRVRSKPLLELKKEIEVLSENGYKEVVLVGINLSAYGKDTGEEFYNAVKEAGNTEKILRVRLGSLEPDHLTEKVIEELSKCKKLCPQFHISLQSGCNKTLKNMNRHYTKEEYRTLCENLRKSFPDCTLTTDIMVGFSGESEEDFLETLEFMKEIGFEKVHVFPYSVRKGTRAESFEGKISKEEKDRRASIMIKEASKIRKDFLKKQKGKILEVLFEKEEDGHLQTGHTKNFIEVKAKSDCNLKGQIRNVKIKDAGEEFCTGEIID